MTRISGAMTAFDATISRYDNNDITILEVGLAYIESKHLFVPELTVEHILTQYPSRLCYHIIN